MGITWQSRWDESWIGMFSMSKSIISQVKFQPSHRPRLKKKLTAVAHLLSSPTLTSCLTHKIHPRTPYSVLTDLFTFILNSYYYLNASTLTIRALFGRTWPPCDSLQDFFPFLKQLDLTICFHFTTYYSFEKMFNFKIFIQWSKRKLISRRVVLLISKKVSVKTSMKSHV